MTPTLTTDIMPIHPDLNTLLVRVMTDHSITHRALAALLDLDRSHITRMANATTAVTLDAVRALYQLTRDPRLVQAVADSGDTVLLDLRDSDMGRPDVDVATLVIALSRVQSSAVSRMSQPAAAAHNATRREIVAEIDDALKSLILTRRRIARGERIPGQYRPATPTSQTTPSSPAPGGGGRGVGAADGEGQRHRGAAASFLPPRAESA